MSELTKRLKRVKTRQMPVIEGKIKKIVTFDLQDWLQDHGDSLGVEDEGDLKLVTRLLGASESNSKRDGRFGASSRGKCQRRQVYGFLGMKAGQMRDPVLQNIFNDGTFRHIRWQLMLMKAGIVTNVEVPFMVPEWRLGTSLDAENDIGGWFLELKGWGGWKNIDDLAKKGIEAIPPEHMLQMHTMLFATGWDTAVYIAESKSTNNWQEVVVKRDEGIINEVRRELEGLNEAIESEIFPSVKAECLNKSGEYKECPYAARCLQHKAQGSPWPEDERWPGTEGTSVHVGRRRRSAAAPRRA